MIGTSRKPACANYDHPDCPGYPEISGKSGNLRKYPESPEKKLLLCDTNSDAVLVVLAERLHA